MTDARQTQTGIELWPLDTPAARATQAGVEMWPLNTPEARVTQVGIELWVPVTNGYRPLTLIMAS